MPTRAPREKLLRILPLGHYFFGGQRVRVDDFRINRDQIKEDSARAKKWRQEVFVRAGPDDPGAWVDFELFAAAAEEFAEPPAGTPPVATAA